MDKLILTKPDDFHCHFRDGDTLETVVLHTAKQFSRAIVMPNLVPPVTTVEQALKYRDRILAKVPMDFTFEPLMTLYLTEQTSLNEIKKAARNSFVHAIKYYPAGATTNSDGGVKDFTSIYPKLEQMQKLGLPLLIHGEVVDPNVDIFDREKIFIDKTLAPTIKAFPDLKIVLEHITTSEAVDFIFEAPNNIAATITPHHLNYNRNEMLVGGINAHYYCLPILKREKHRLALNKAAISSSPKFFAGTDSAPHFKQAKESSCGCAGCYTAPIALELYAKAFEKNNALDKLEAFTSYYGADFYGLARNTNKITLQKKSQIVASSYHTKKGELVPLNAGKTLSWSLA